MIYLSLTNCNFEFKLLVSSNWWPFFLLAFYLIAPFPTIISRKYGDGTGNSTPCQEMAVFLTSVIVVSAFGLPIVLARAPIAAPVVGRFW